MLAMLTLLSGSSVTNLPNEVGETCQTKAWALTCWEDIVPKGHVPPSASVRSLPGWGRSLIPGQSW